MADGLAAMPPPEQPPTGDGAEPSFGQFLLDRRRAAGLSQQALARAVGVDQSYIARFENGTRPPPDRPLVVRLAQALTLDEADRQRLLRAAGHASDWSLTLPPDDPTVLAITGFLADPAISDAAKRTFRQVVTLLLGRWRTE